MSHVSVLLHEAIDGLALAKGQVYFDGTLGGAGHAESVAKQFGNDIKIIATDLDTDTILAGTKVLERYSKNFTLVKANFRDVKRVLSEAKVSQVDAILLDLGLRSDQLDSSGRGFSFRYDEPLLMTFTKNPEDNTVTAYDVVNTWSEETLADIMYGYSDERYARRIAKAIVEAREDYAIMTTGQLVAIIEGAVPGSYRHGKTHPATKTFQAIRMAVNDEVNALKEGLADGIEVLAPKGRMAVISFHSVEDRIVKDFFRERVKEGVGKLINKKPIIPTEAEVKANPRSRSAKLRIFAKN